MNRALIGIFGSIEPQIYMTNLSFSDAQLPHLKKHSKNGRTAQELSAIFKESTPDGRGSCIPKGMWFKSQMDPVRPMVLLYTRHFDLQEHMAMANPVTH